LPILFSLNGESLQLLRHRADDTDSKSWLRAVHEQYEDALRHCFATHMLDNGAELPIIQVLLGHDDPRDTMIYLHLSTRKLKSAPSPLQMFDLAGQTRQEPAAS
jgi:site-specific recombinase XerD